MPLSAWFEWWRIKKEKERYAAGFKDGAKVAEKRGWEKGIEEGRRLEREKVMAEIASKSNGDVNARR